MLPRKWYHYLRPEHIPAWSRLRAQMQVPLATGECLYTRFEFLDLLAAQGADIIQPDVCACGGLLEMRKIAAIAEAHYVTVAPHNPMGPLATAVNLHFAAATPTSRFWNTISLAIITGWMNHMYPGMGFWSCGIARGLELRWMKKPLAKIPISTGNAHARSAPMVQPAISEISDQ